jgi:hypothetical protein
MRAFSEATSLQIVCCREQPRPQDRGQLTIKGVTSALLKQVKDVTILWRFLDFARREKDVCRPGRAALRRTTSAGPPRGISPQPITCEWRADHARDRAQVQRRHPDVLRCCRKDGGTDMRKTGGRAQCRRIRVLSNTEVIARIRSARQRPSQSTHPL